MFFRQLEADQLNIDKYERGDNTKMRELQPLFRGVKKVEGTVPPSLWSLTLTDM